MCLIQLLMHLFLQCCLGAELFYNPDFAEREPNCSHLAKVRQESRRQKREHDSFLKPLETFLPIRLILWVMRIGQCRHTGMEL